MKTSFNYHGAKMILEAPIISKMQVITHTIEKVAAAALISVIFTGVAFGQAGDVPTSRLIYPADLAKIVQSASSKRPLILQVGSRVLFTEAHIPGSEYVGAASTASGIQTLRKRLEGVPKNTFIVLYCGCCPWGRCPNVKPADDVLKSMGFTNLKILYIASNFGTDWVEKGYPVAKGE